MRTRVDITNDLREAIQLKNRNDTKRLVQEFLSVSPVIRGAVLAKELEVNRATVGRWLRAESIPGRSVLSGFERIATNGIGSPGELLSKEDLKYLITVIDGIEGKPIPVHLALNLIRLRKS